MSQTKNFLLLHTNVLQSIHVFILIFEIWHFCPLHLRHKNVQWVKFSQIGTWVQDKTGFIVPFIKHNSIYCCVVTLA